MEPQPELYVTGGLAVLALILMDMSNKNIEDAPKLKRKPLKARAKPEAPGDQLSETEVKAVQKEGKKGQ